MERLRKSIQRNRSFSSGYSVGIIGVHFVPARIQVPAAHINDAETVLAAHSIVVDAIWRQLYSEVDSELDRIEGAILRTAKLDMEEASEPLLILRRLRMKIRQLKR